MSKFSIARSTLATLGAASLAAIGTPAAAQEADQETPEQEAQEEAREIVVTGKFQDTGAQSATKLDIPVLDTPFSTSSYNENFLDAIATTNVSDTYRYMTGIQRAGNTSYDITFRGFKTSGNDRNAILTDGMPGLSVRFGSPPTVGTDHIELVKGPMSVLYGQAQPGGFINIITKKPSATPHFAVEARSTLGAGTYRRAKGGLFSFDLTGPVTADDSLTARAVGEFGYGESFRRDAYETPVYFAPSVAWKPWDRTTITLQGEYRYVKAHYDTFLVAPFRDASRVASIDTTYQEPDDYLVEKGWIGNAFVRHAFSDAITFNAGYRWVDHFDTQRNYDVVGFRTAANDMVTRRARGQENRRTYSFFDANLTARFETLGIGHILLVGASGGQETASLNRLQFYNLTAADGQDVSLYNPAIGRAPAPWTFPLFNAGQASNLNWRHTTQNSLGFYASDLMTLTDWLKVLAGVRHADETQTIEDKRIATFVPVKKKDKKWLPLAGILVQPTKNLTLYTSYSTSFVPVAASSQDNFGLNPFKPTEAESIEGGVKAEILGGRLNLSAAYFDITKKNTLNTFVCLTAAQLAAAGITIPPGATIAVGTCSNQLGGERSRGYEIEFNGSPLPGWQVTGGYAHVNARVTASNIPVQNGARLTNAPGDAFNMWSRYDFKDGPLSNVGFGVGVSYIGKRAGLLPTVSVPAGAPAGGTLPLDSYVTVDFGIYYSPSDKIDLTLKATNLLDERYIESAGFSGDIQLVPGTPRQVVLMARIKL
ncbi:MULTISPECIES: TonB-dependent receptor [unclassified Sphingomonas]|jgi:iron complex outermembrane recepter protein|nr:MULTISPECIES: TonB-dependent receptor [unclassified Sphingomonas]